MKLSKMSKRQLIEAFELQCLRHAGDAWIKNEEEKGMDKPVTYQGKQYFFHTIMSESHEITLTETPDVQTQEEWNKSIDVYIDDPQYESVVVQLIQASK